MRVSGGGFDLFRIIYFNTQRLIRVVVMLMGNCSRRMRRFVNHNGFFTKVFGDLRTGFPRVIGTKPPSARDYVTFSQYYVAKKLLFTIALFLIVLPILYLKIAHPAVQARFSMATMYLNAPEMTGYTGRVTLLLPSTDQVLYAGQIKNGRITGQGVLWDQEGNLVYQGGFLMEMYDGEGELFYSDGRTMYKGSFVKNYFDGVGYYYYPETGILQYEGSFAKDYFEGVGKKYYSNGMLQYEGDFSRGYYHGTGWLYDPDGQLVFVGGFKDGKQEGRGILYKEGQVLYEGQLAAGKLNGEGKVYSGGAVLYEGFFKDNNFEGAGKAYDPFSETLIYDGEFSGGNYSGNGKLFDPLSGNLLYEGGFYDGAYEGEGKLYNTTNGFLLYEGGFRMGFFDGKGVLYDFISGLKQYEGGFLLDSYNGEGALYDQMTGLLQVRGVFRSGVLISAGENGAGSGAGSGDNKQFTVEPNGAYPSVFPSFPDDMETVIKDLLGESDSEEIDGYDTEETENEEIIVDIGEDEDDAKETGNAIEAGVPEQLLETAASASQAGQLELDIP